MKFSACDVYLNVVGGLRINEPAADAAVALALCSSIRDIPVPPELIAFGEVGLSGEMRAVSNANGRAAEAARIGFTSVAMPVSKSQRGKLTLPGMTTVPMAGVYDLLLLLSKAAKQNEK